MPLAESERPRVRIQAECRRRGKRIFVMNCVELLKGGQVDDELVLALGGAHARALLATDALETHGYWLRVWAARGLMWEWDDLATEAICSALSDDAWRVREMACKVIRRNQLGDALPVVVPLMSDPSTRVQAAARGAVQRLIAAGA